MAPIAKSAPDATVVVATRNRREDLGRLLPTVLAQTACIEVLVIDDGSTDGTAAMVAADFPDVRLKRSEVSQGYIAQRNQAATLARAPLIVSVDDDALLPSRETVAQTIADFNHPRIGAVAIPYVDVRHRPEVLQRAPDDDRPYVVDTFVGTAHAVRRDVFVKVGGYRTALGHQCEEADFCLRMLDAGFTIRLGRAQHLLHLESPKRNLDMVFVKDRRNNMLHGWHNVPMPYLPVRLAKVTLHSIALARRHGHAGPMLRGLGQGWRYGLRCRAERRPVARSTYRLDHLLRKRGPIALAEIEPMLVCQRQEGTCG